MDFSAFTLISQGIHPALGRQTTAGWGNTLFSSKMRQYHSPDGADGCCITSNRSFACLQLAFNTSRIGAIFGMLSRRAGLSASAGLSCFYYIAVFLYLIVRNFPSAAVKFVK